MNCPNCGRELYEGEVCTCTANTENVAYAVPEQEPVQQPETTPLQEPVYQPTYQENPAYTQPVYEAQQNYYNPNQPPYFDPALINPAPSTDYPNGYKPKKKYVAVLLAVTFGFLGLHNFYLGNSSKGVAQLLIALIGSLALGLGFVVAYVWAFVDAYNIITDKAEADANGFKIMTFAEELAKAQQKD